MTKQQADDYITRAIAQFRVDHPNGPSLIFADCYLSGDERDEENEEEMYVVLCKGRAHRAVYLHDDATNSFGEVDF